MPYVSYRGMTGPMMRKYTMSENAMMTSQICQNFITPQHVPGSRSHVPRSGILLSPGTWDVEPGTILCPR